MDSIDVKQKKIHKEYQDLANSISPKSNIIGNCIRAFLVGGTICTFGQLITNIAKNYYDMNTEEASTITSISLIFISALLTGMVYTKKSGKGQVQVP